MGSSLVKIFGFYYLFCGLTGVLLPESWYWAGGLSRDLPDLMVRITAVLLLALGLGFWSARRNSALLPGVVFVAFWASLLDIAAVGAGVVSSEISTAKGLGFIGVDMAAILGLSKLYKNSK